MNASSRWKPSGDGITTPQIPEFLSRVTATAGCPSSTPVIPPEKDSTMSKPSSTDKVVPITVGNPASVASFLIDQKHMEDYTMTEEEKSSVVEVKRPPKGIYFTVPAAEKNKPNSVFVFLLEIQGRDPYLVTPEIAKEHSEEDVIRPILLVRYVTMLGEEALWPLKLDPPDVQKSNRWNTSAKNIVAVAASGKWVRLISKQKSGHYRHTVSRKTFEEDPPKFSDRTIIEMVDAAYDEDHRVSDNNHEIWTILAEGSTK